MNATDRGRKHTCPDCNAKYYDLHMKVVACPACGAKPPVAKLSRRAPAVKKTVRTTFGRFP